jgi:subtilisin-like proprotein convertase family protein
VKNAEADVIISAPEKHWNKNANGKWILEIYDDYRE